MKEESHNPRIDPELEARIVALVLGEASDFERDELERLIEERSELVAFKKQIQSVHGLLSDVATGESIAEDDDWKLSGEKRSAVLAVISGEAEEQPAKQVINNSVDRQNYSKGNVFWNFTKIAAVLCVVVGITGALLLSGVQRAREVARRHLSVNSLKQSALAVHNFHDTYKSLADDEKGFVTAEPEAVAGFRYEMDSKSALADIRDSLDFGTTAPAEAGNGAEPRSQPAARLPNLLTDGIERRFAAPSAAEANRLGLSEHSLNGIAEEHSSRLGLFATDGAGWADRRVEDGDPPTVAEPTVPNAGNGTGALGFGDQPAEAGRPESFGLTVDAIQDIGGETGQLMSERGAARRYRGRSLEQLKSAVPSFESQGSGQGQAPSQGLSRQLEAIDSPATEFDEDADGIVLGGKSLNSSGRYGGGGLAGDRTVPEGELSNESSADHMPEGNVTSDLRRGHRTADSKKSAPSGPIAAEMSDRTMELKAERAFGKEVFDVEGFDSGVVANPLPSPTKKPVASSENLMAKGSLIVADGDGEELARESVPLSSDLNGDVTLPHSRNLHQHDYYSHQMSDPVTDPVTGTSPSQPSVELWNGQAEHTDRWSYSQKWSIEDRRSSREFVAGSRAWSKEQEANQASTRGEVTHEIEKRAKDSLGSISALNELYENAINAGDLLLDDYATTVNGKGVDAQPEPKDRRIKSLQQRDQLSVAGQYQWKGYVPPILANSSTSMPKAAVRKSPASAGLNEQTAEDEAFSTFSLHVSDVAFKLARAALANGEWPEAAQVRIEEFVNAFDYGDPMPSRSEKVACRLEQSVHPFLQQRNLLRVSMRTAAAGRSSNTPLRLTLLLDNSGSMERADRQQTVRLAVALLAQQLKPIDQVTLISFARQPRLLADRVSGAQTRQLVQLIQGLPREGGTNIEAALQLAFEKAQEQRIDNTQNRIILVTDGAVNLGDANPESLSRMITTIRDAGIAFDAAGISADGLNDEVLEALTRQGDGRYYLLDSPEDAADGFARQIAGALRPSAKNVKVQIEFNPKRVGRYKLLGFEKHRLKQEDFRNDKVDAAEMTAAEAGVAMYQFEAKPDGEGDVGSVSVRFRDLSTGQMIENRWPIPYEANAPRVDQAAPSLRIAISAALLAARLRGEPLGESVDLQTLSNLIAGLPDRDRNAIRVQQLQLMIQQARQVSGK
ncbi:MAG: von Willebrand factor type A domain-containing protein [Planctomycetota bacterium]|nr:von Willebrand factor type A domain-containing protein [Planctomycetota bacterium]